MGTYNVNLACLQLTDDLPGTVSCTFSTLLAPLLQVIVVPSREGVAVTANELTSVTKVLWPIDVDVRLVSVAVKSPQTNISLIFSTVGELASIMILFSLHCSFRALPCHINKPDDVVQDMDTGSPGQWIC